MAVHVLEQVVEVGAVEVFLAAGDGEVVAVALVKGSGLDDVLAQAEGAAVIILQQDPALAGIVEGRAAGGVLECDLFHGVAPFVLCGRAFWLA